MKLVFFTPAAKTSAIGRMASLLIRALMSIGQEVRIVRTDHESLLSAPTHEFGVELVAWNSLVEVKELIANADALVYQIGDNYLFHKGALHWLFREPGIVILHDFYLANLFHEWARDHRDYADLALQYWAHDGGAGFFEHKDSSSFIKATIDNAPMTEWICSVARGVVTHSSWGLPRVMESCPGPVMVVPLAYNIVEVLAQPDAESHDRSDKLQLLTVGHVNANKRVESVISAIGQSEYLREHCVYNLVGKVKSEVGDELVNLAKEKKVELMVYGEVDEVVLADAFKRADVVMCLRWPSLEAASASAIEAMLHGKSVVVTDTGFYRELPDNCVVKVSPENEVSEIQCSLETLCQDAQLRRVLSSEARRWAAKTFTPENYAASLVDMASKSGEAFPITEAINFFSGLLVNWEADSGVTGEAHLSDPLKLFEHRGGM